jgi:antitoxin MazE
MTVQVLKKWGNSPAVRIPVAIMQSTQLALDQAVEVHAEGRRIIIEPVTPTYTLDDLLNGITAENRYAELDFGVAQGQEQL